MGNQLHDLAVFPQDAVLLIGYKAEFTPGAMKLVMT
jgi:hypothetical protein